jgi:hypothetical protein
MNRSPCPIRILSFALFLVAAPALAEGPDPSWAVHLRPYVWIPTLTADTQAQDVPATADVEFPGTLKQLETVIMLNTEFRGRSWGLLVDGLYLKMSGDTTTPGPYFNLIETTIDASVVDVGVVYRVVQGRRGWIDALAGGRYVSLGIDSDLIPDFEAIDEISASAVDKAVDAVRDEVGDAVDRVSGELAEELAGLTSGVGAAAGDRIRDEVSVRIPASSRPVIATPVPVAGRPVVATREQDLSDAIRDAIADAVQARLDGKISSLQGNAKAIRDEIRRAAREAVDDLKRTASKRVQRALEEAERKLADEIEASMVKAADADVSARVSWVDPYVGARARFAVTERFFIGGRADVGGFGVGSEFTWQAFAGLGYAVSNHVDLEAGWRHLAIDYDGGDVVFDATISGLVLGLGIRL